MENGKDRKTPMVVADPAHGPARVDRETRLEEATGEAKTMPVLQAPCLINEQPEAKQESGYCRRHGNWKMVKERGSQSS